MLVVSTPVAFAHAEAPGYGGNADQLSVSWVEPSAASPNAAPAGIWLGGGVRSAGALIIADEQPQMTPDRLNLRINGLGFRAKSGVSIRIGDGAPVTTRSDTAGSVDLTIDPHLLGGAEPGLSVIAIGRARSGMAVTLYGSVPPEPAGTGIMTVVPWATLAIAVGSLGYWVRGRRRLAAGTDASTRDTAGP